MGSCLQLRSLSIRGCRRRLELDRAVGQLHTQGRYAPRGRSRCPPRPSRPRRAPRRRDHRCAAPMRQPAATMQSRSSQPSPISAPLRITERSTVLPAPIETSSPSTDEAAHVRAVGDRARRARAPPAGSTRPRTSAPASIASQSSPSRSPTAVLHVALDDVEGALQVALGGADVQPVALRREPVQAVADEPRPHLALDRDVAVGAAPARGSRARARRRRR